MKLLLHTCCAPCAIYAAGRAQKDNFAVTGFFYNPNIQPLSEYIRRKKEAENYFKSEGLTLVCAEYETRDFFSSIAKNTAPPERCLSCWKTRLEKCASFASESGFAAFSTTLLGSVHQDHEGIKKISGDLSKKKKVKFYYKDFRTGKRDARRIAKEKGMYCQNYCGCVFSMVEREEKRKAKRLEHIAHRE